MLKLLLLSSILLINLTASQNAPLRNKELSTKEMKKQNKFIVNLAAQEMNKSTPQAIDKLTTLVQVRANKTTLEYIYEINIAPKTDKYVQKQNHSKMKDAIIRGTCNKSKRFLQADIDITYIYKSSLSKVELFRFNVNQKSCSLLK
jgi:hypothetical protein